ncbi:MAG: 50S ribosomal protein L13 [Anaerolineae bacterium]|nr:50S ribosomal protein L13 [Anaerolineae bacterium]
MRTFTPTPKDIERRWYVVDAQGKTLGRLASEIAKVLTGKRKPTYAAHMDVGDFVIVVNADKVNVTGRKLDQKRYYRHSLYPGGLRSISLRDQLRRFPERVIQHAVKGMLPKNTVGKQQLKKLKVYAGESHPHQAQIPEPLEL